MTQEPSSELRAPKWRRIPGKQTLDYEMKGRVVCPGCAGKGCNQCNRRGWMIDESAIKDEWHG